MTKPEEYMLPSTPGKTVPVQMLYDKRVNLRYSVIPVPGKAFTHCETYDKHRKWMNAGCHHAALLELAYNLSTPGGQERRAALAARSMGIYTLSITPIVDLATEHEERVQLALKNRMLGDTDEVLTPVTDFLSIWHLFYSHFPTDGCDFVGLDYQLRCYAHENPVERPRVYLLSDPNNSPTGVLVIGDTNLVEATFTRRGTHANPDSKVARR